MGACVGIDGEDGGRARRSLEWPTHMAENPQRVAVIDVGSNSTRLLVADVDGGVSVLERQSRVTRLGRGVDLSGQLADEAIEAACAAIADYVEICRESGAETGRRDRHQRRARRLQRRRLRRRAARALRPLGPRPRRRGGGPPHLSRRHRRTASLGADAGDRHRRGLDRDDRRHRHRDRLPYLAAGRRRPPHRAPHLRRPPHGGRARGTRRRRSGPDRQTPSRHDEARAAAGIAVAGTPTSLSAVELGLEPYDPARVHGHVLSLATIQRLLSRSPRHPWPSGPRSPACTPTGRRRSSPAA